MTGSELQPTDDVSEAVTRRTAVCSGCRNEVVERPGGVARCETCGGFVCTELRDDEPRPWPIAGTALTLLALPAVWVVTRIMRWRDER